VHLEGGSEAFEPNAFRSRGLLSASFGAKQLREVETFEPKRRPHHDGERSGRAWGNIRGYFVIEFSRRRTMRPAGEIRIGA